MQRNIRSRLNVVILVPVLVEQGDGEGDHGAEDQAGDPAKGLEEIRELVAGIKDHVKHVANA